MSKIYFAKIAALIFVAGLLTFSVKSQDKKDDEVIKVNTDLVTVPVIVSDRQNRYIAGLKEKDFTLLQNGKPQKIEFFVNEEAPITVALMLDTSRSTQFVLDDIKDAAVEFIKSLRPNDRTLILTFDNNVEFLSGLTADKKELESAIKNARIGDNFGTVLNDAVSQVVNKNLKTVKGRKAIVLLTDGKDAGSDLTQTELLYQLAESDTMVYSIFYATGGNQRRRIFDGGNFPNRGIFGRIRERQRQGNNQRVNRKNEEAAEFLQTAADETAGRFYRNDVTKLNEIFSSIADELRKQYVLGFYPEQSNDRTDTFQVKVQINRADAVVRSKNTYRGKAK